MAHPFPPLPPPAPPPQSNFSAYWEHFQCFEDPDILAFLDEARNHFNYTGINDEVIQSPLIRLQKRADLYGFISRNSEYEQNHNKIFSALSDLLFGTPEKYAIIRNAIAYHLHKYQSNYEEKVTIDYDTYVREMVKDRDGDIVCLHAAADLFYINIVELTSNKRVAVRQYSCTRGKARKVVYLITSTPANSLTPTGVCSAVIQSQIFSPVAFNQEMGNPDIPIERLHELCSSLLPIQDVHDPLLGSANLDRRLHTFGFQKQSVPTTDKPSLYQALASIVYHDTGMSETVRRTTFFQLMFYNTWYPDVKQAENDSHFSRKSRIEVEWGEEAALQALADAYCVIICHLSMDHIDIIKEYAPRWNRFKSVIYISSATCHVFGMSKVAGT